MYAKQENVGAGNDPEVFCAEIKNAFLFIFPSVEESNYPLYPDNGQYRLQIIMLLIRLPVCFQ